MVLTRQFFGIYHGLQRPPLPIGLRLPLGHRRLEYAADPWICILGNARVLQQPGARHFGHSLLRRLLSKPEAPSALHAPACLVMGRRRSEIRGVRVVVIVPIVTDTPVAWSIVLAWHDLGQDATQLQSEALQHSTENPIPSKTRPSGGMHQQSWSNTPTWHAQFRWQLRAQGQPHASHRAPCPNDDTAILIAWAGRGTGSNTKAVAQDVPHGRSCPSWIQCPRNVSCCKTHE